MESTGSLASSVMGRSSMVLKISASYYFSGSPHQNYLTPQNVKYFIYLNSVVVSGERCTREINPWLSG